MRFFRFILTATLLSTNYLANAEDTGKEKSEHGQKNKKKAEPKNDSSNSNDLQIRPKTVTAPGGYIHSWLTQPALKGYDLAGGTIIFTPKAGSVSVTLFLASWCTVCQEIISHITELDRKYSSYGVDFYYAFANDLPTDVRGFVRERKLNPEKTLILSEQVMREFHDPILPTVYISDRKGFVAGRFNYDNKTTPDLSELKKRLEGLLLY